MTPNVAAYLAIRTAWVQHPYSPLNGILWTADDRAWAALTASEKDMALLFTSALPRMCAKLTGH